MKLRISKRKRETDIREIIEKETKIQEDVWR